MIRFLIRLYGLLCYCMFVLVFVYAEGFLLEIVVRKTINSGEDPALLSAHIINLALVFAFGFFHSLMSRSWFKRRWTRVIPKEAERSTYVLQASLTLALVMWQWQPMPTVIWLFDDFFAWPFYLSFVLGNIVILWSTFLMDHFELFGLRQVWCHQAGQLPPISDFKTPSLYKYVRHPMHLGTLMVFWSTPLMTAGHLLFALAMTLYVLIGIKFEERSLKRDFGEQYTLYQQRVPMLIPSLRCNM